MFNKINKYISMELSKNILKIFFIFYILLFLILTFDEANFFKKIENINVLLIFKLILLKTPTILLSFSPFIFLFGGILFHLSLKNRNEIIAIRTIGISNFKLISVSAIISLFFGYIIVFFFNPLSSISTKEYEAIKSDYLQNTNSIFINDNGLWFLMNNKFEKKIIRIENLDLTKNLGKNIIILDFDRNFEFQSRIDAKEGIFENKTIKILNSTVTTPNEKAKNIKTIKELQIDINFSLAEIQNTFKNSSSISIYELKKLIKNIQELGYSADYLKIEYQKLMSLPIYLLAMVVLSGLMIVNLGTNKSYIFYVVLGIIISAILYFLSDLSITMGKAATINLELSVWLPIFFIMLVNFIGLIQVNAK